MGALLRAELFKQRSTRISFGLAAGTEIAVALTEHECDGHGQAGELSGCDALVLPLELSKQGSGPVSDGRQCIRAAGLAEKRGTMDVNSMPFGSSSLAPNCQAVC